MRVSDRNLCLGIVLVALVVFDFVLRDPSSGFRESEPVLTDFDSESATSIRIEHGETTLDLTLAGGRWVVAQCQDFPAYPARIDDLLQRLERLRTSAIVSSEDGSSQLFGFDDPTRVVVRDAALKVTAELELGSPSDDASGAYVRVAGASDIYRAVGLDSIDTRPMLWVDAHVLDLEIPAVKIVRAELAGGEWFELIKTDSGRWAAVGASRDLPAARVDPLLLVADTLYFEEVSDATPEEVGLTAPSVRLRFTLLDGRVMRLDLGGMIGATRAATRPDWSSPWVVRIPASSAARLEAVVREVLDALN